MDSPKLPYVRPEVTGEEEFETHAIGCAKVPGLGDINYCGPIWGAPTGNRSGCWMNPPSVSRSS
jgi:hypothetical protein